MRIVDFKTFIVHDGYRSFVFLKLYADDGTTGVGEGTIEWNELAAEACIRQTCTRIPGADPFRTEALWERLHWGRLLAERPDHQQRAQRHRPGVRGPQGPEARRSRPRAPGRPAEGSPPGLRQRSVLGLPDTR